MSIRTTLVGVIAIGALLVAPAARAGGSHAENLLTRQHDLMTVTPPAGEVLQQLAPKLQLGRLATAKYVTNLALAKKNGYGVITRMIPGMGWHFLNPKVTTFDITKPPILVYGRHGSRWQLVAFEWVFPKKPAEPPLPGATYGSFGAACHYKDGTFVFQADQNACAPKSPQSGAAFNFWHPDLVTLHVWAWYPNPDGIYSGLNPLMHAFDEVPPRPHASTSTTFASKRYDYSLVLPGGSARWFVSRASVAWDGSSPSRTQPGFDIYFDLQAGRYYMVAARPLEPGKTLEDWTKYVVGITPPVCSVQPSVSSSALDGVEARLFAGACVSEGYVFVALTAIHADRGYDFIVLSKATSTKVSDRQAYEAARGSFRFLQEARP